MAKFALADRLRKTMAEIDAMPVTEFAEWMAFYKIRKEDQD